MSPISSNHSPVIPIATPFDLTDYPELAGISAISGTGLVARTAVGVYATRTITGTTNQITVTDGNGVVGNPTISLPQNIHTAATPQFAGIGLGTAYSSGRIQIVSGTTSADGIFWGTDTNLYRSAANTLKTDDALIIADTTASTSSTTGALIVSGGAGIAKDSFINSVRIGRGTSSIAHNIAIGEGSPLGAITTGDRNIAIGSGALAAVSTTATNTAIGFVAGNAFTGQKGIFIGAYAGYGRTSGDNNIVIGGGVGTTATGAGNVILGIGSGQGLTSGAYNLTMGSSAGANITTGSSNVLIGESAGYFLTQGYQNVAIGGGSASGWYSAGATLTTGIQNTYIGTGAGKTNSTGNYNVAIGNIAGFLSTTSNNIFIGNMAGRYATTESSELFIDNQNRTNRAGDVAGAIIYGVMSATPASQTLALNAQVSLGSPEQVRVTNTASANRYITLTGSNGGNPTIGTSAGSLAITSASGATYFNAPSGNTDGTIYIRPTGTGVYSSVQFRSATDTGTAQLICDSGTALYLDSAAGNYTRIRSGGYTHVRVGATASANRYLIFDGSNGGNPTIDVSAGSLAITPATVFASTITTTGGATFHTTSTALTNGAGAGAGTLTNAPAAGDPTKWIGINDNGTTRYIPAW